MLVRRVVRRLRLQRLGHPAPVRTVAVVHHVVPVKKAHQLKRPPERNLLAHDRRIRHAVVHLRAVDRYRVADERQVAHRSRHHPEEPPRRRHDVYPALRRRLKRGPVRLAQPLLRIEQRPVKVQRHYPYLVVHLSSAPHRKPSTSDPPDGQLDFVPHLLLRADH